MNILKSIPITVTVGNNVVFFLKKHIYIYGDGVRERYIYNILRGLAHPLCYSHRLSPLSRPRIGDLGWLQPDELKSRFGPAFSEAAFSVGVGESQIPPQMLDVVLDDDDDDDCHSCWQ